VPVYVKDLKFPVMLYKQVFKNKDGSAGVRYVATKDGRMSGDLFKTRYREFAGVYGEDAKQSYIYVDICVCEIRHCAEIT
jgi:hypothetical protein